ncbi:hypothetical protein JNUCC0626_20155 [Lentzea sp. JNUCC 0626]|uniref:hypothetical protein n=1 Tax=Lentzea sp. JNUCC 0626 TaxID=3367513 RepID=UPI003749E029
MSRSRNDSGITDVDDYLSDPRFIECRSEGHAWQRQHRGWVIEETGSGAVLTRTAHCRNPCGLVRIRRKTFDGVRLHSVYQDTQGYYVTGITLTRDEVDAWEYQQDNAKPKSRRRKAA